MKGIKTEYKVVNRAWLEIHCVQKHPTFYCLCCVGISAQSSVFYSTCLLLIIVNNTLFSIWQRLLPNTQLPLIYNLHLIGKLLLISTNGVQQVNYHKLGLQHAALDLFCSTVSLATRWHSELRQYMRIHQIGSSMPLLVKPSFMTSFLFLLCLLFR